MRNKNTVFLTMCHSFFMAIIWRVLKACFAWKQQKADYSKNTWEEKNCQHDLVCSLVSYISVKMNYLKCITVGTEAHGGRKIKRNIWPNFDFYFPHIWQVWER